MPQGQPLRELGRADPALASAEAFHDAVIVNGQPVVIRGLGADLPAVAAGPAAPDEALRYLAQFDSGHSPQVFSAGEDTAGRYFYNDDLTGFNFERLAMPLAQAFSRMLDHAAGKLAGSCYIGSLAAPHYLPGFREANALPIVPATIDPLLWIGNASHVACHYDAYENLACVLYGSRRFTLYPPDAIGDLYVGPIDHTMAGQPVSMAAADPHNPAYPRFAAAQARALVVDLGPGDALFLPKLWWHQVEATAPVNVMLNYWWDATATGPDAPMLSMLHALIAIAERPDAERAAFRAFFDHFVFRPDGHPLAHLPEARRGVLQSLRGGGYGQIRAMIVRALRGG
ncbi:MAG: cupin-like domain-containing protein [Novosphingobium sp.]|nr:cupin-like domain-containing protein [Novosphingobium sp.]